MKNNNALSEHFCQIPPIKVFCLSLSTFGLYLVYWYEMQYAKSKKIQRSAFKDFLKSYFFVIFSFKLFEKIHILLNSTRQKEKRTYQWFFAAKFLVAIALEGVFYYFYSMHVFFIALLILEAACATILQSFINDNMDPSHSTPWQSLEWFHLVIFIGGCVLLLFFQFSEDPLALFKR